MTYNNDANKVAKPKDIQDQVNLLIYSNNNIVTDVRKMTKQISELYELDEETWKRVGATASRVAQIDKRLNAVEGSMRRTKAKRFLAGVFLLWGCCEVISAAKEHRERREQETENMKTEIEMLKNQASERKTEIDALKARLNREQTKDETDG